MDGSIDRGEYQTMPVFDLQIPKAVAGVDPTVLNPRNTWTDKEAYDKALKHLAELFARNFKTFTDTPEGKRLEAAGPRA